MSSIHIKVDDEFKARVAEKAAQAGSDMTAVMTSLLAAWLDGRIPATFDEETVVLARMPTKAELLFTLSNVAQSAALEDAHVNSARFLPLLFSREMVDAILDALEQYVWS